MSGESRPLRPSGLCAGEFTVPDDFDAPVSAREDFVHWFDAACRDAIPEHPDDFLPRDLADHVFEVLWKKMEERGGIIPPDDSIPGDGVSKGESA